MIKQEDLLQRGFRLSRMKNIEGIKFAYKTKRRYEGNHIFKVYQG